MLLVKGDDSAARQAAEESGITIIETTQSKEGTLDFRIGERETSIAAAPDEPDEPEPEAPAFILQTSGTTSEPKLIPTSHRNMLAAAARVQAWFNLTPQDRCLSVSPVFYAHGLHVTVFTPLLTGGTVAFPTDASKFDYSEWFGILRPTWYSAGPTLHRLVFDQTQSRRMQKRDIRCASSYQVARRFPGCSRGTATHVWRSCGGALWIQRRHADLPPISCRRVAQSRARAVFPGRIRL